MKGYHNQPELTAEAIDSEGWFHTGDKARLEGRNIYITGRLKNMIVLSGGKKVFPEEVETVLEKSDKFSEICVFLLHFSTARGKMSTATVPGGHIMVISSAMFYFSNYYFFGEKK